MTKVQGCGKGGFNPDSEGMMAEILCFASHNKRKTAQRGFKEWRRIFGSAFHFDENTRWADLPDEVILFLCEESPERKNSLYDLLMSAHCGGSGRDFEAQAFDRLTGLLNAYFLISDQARFECMRRLGWLERIIRENQSIIEIVMDAGSYEYSSAFEVPEPTPTHPAYEEDLQSRGMDRPALVRKFIPEALRLFKERVKRESPATQ
ncbi:MAG TPA: hypothetical protein PK250_12655 [Syntrophobacter fumaroxidans]|nr:hypothetical protein [Syntrophobacter fumaroxidans]